jgi:hypothetical protein
LRRRPPPPVPQKARSGCPRTSIKEMRPKVLHHSTRFRFALTWTPQFLDTTIFNSSIPISSIPLFPKPESQNCGNCGFNCGRMVEVIEETAVPRNIIRGTISGKHPRKRMTTRLPQSFLQTSCACGFAVTEDGLFEPIDPGKCSEVCPAMRLQHLVPGDVAAITSIARIGRLESRESRIPTYIMQVIPTDRRG